MKLHLEVFVTPAFVTVQSLRCWRSLRPAFSTLELIEQTFIPMKPISDGGLATRV